MASAKTTIDHETIKNWVEAHGGCPARVQDSGSGDDPGIIRIDYPGYSGTQSLDAISWEEFFDKFEESQLAFLYQEEENEEDSRFSKLVKRDSVDYGNGAGENGADAEEEDHNAAETDELKRMSVKQLRAQARQLKVSGGRRMRKQQLIDAIEQTQRH